MKIDKQNLLEIINPNGKKESPDKDKTLALLRHDKVSKPLILVGTASCGRVAGAMKTLDTIRAYADDHNLDIDIVETGCIGLCSQEPIVDIQLPGKSRLSFKQVQSHKVYLLLDAVMNNIVLEEHLLAQHHREGHENWNSVPFFEDLPYFEGQKKILTNLFGRIDPENIAEFVAHNGYRSFVKVLRNYTSENVIEVVEKSGLRGRGGGGFPTGKKWRTAFQSRSDQKYLICNADESDPGAFMDRSILESNPHLLLEGLSIAAYAIGASRVYIYIRSEYPLAIARLQKAVQQNKELGLSGDNVLSSGFKLIFEIRKGAGAFVCGEETALINSLEGKRGIPRARPPWPAQSGLLGKPTVVNNAETIANIPLILSKGPDWYAGIGTKNSKGTKLFSLSGKLKNTGLIEVPMGAKLEDIIYKTGEGIKNNNKLKAVQIGGPSGNVIDDTVLDLTIDYEEMAEKDVFMGSGGMVIMGEDSCMVDMAAFFMKFLQKESCGKCIPCREGTRRMVEILDQIRRKPNEEEEHQTLKRFKGVMQLESLARIIKDTSLCGLGKSAPNPVLSTLRYFRKEYEEHIFDRECVAGICQDLRIFEINVEKCTGCTACAKKCPTNAIIGTRNNPFFIVQDKCIGCGLCHETCKFNAVLIK